MRTLLLVLAATAALVALQSGIVAWVDARAVASTLLARGLLADPAGLAGLLGLFTLRAGLVFGGPVLLAAVGSAVVCRARPR